MLVHQEQAACGPSPTAPPRLKPGGTLQLMTRFWQVLFGWGQYPVARIRGTRALGDTQDSPRDHLEGVAPVVEDWHTRMTLFKVRNTAKISVHLSLCN